jgi:hypothetical protein
VEESGSGGRALTGFYSRDAMRQAREERDARERRNTPGQVTLDQIPADAPADDAVLTVWNGERWVAWETWRASAPIAREESAPCEEIRIATPAEATPTRRGEELQIKLPIGPEAARD